MSKELQHQLDFFPNSKTELECVWEKYNELKDSHNNVRKRVFGEIEDIKLLLNETRGMNERILWLLSAQNTEIELVSNG